MNVHAGNQIFRRQLYKCAFDRIACWTRTTSRAMLSEV